ncbi:MAG: MarC family protein [Sphingobacteriales bacterium]|jgi:multiple antibiotic resistance protein|nr:MarC family protein [Sphingobacteriales bacterium]
MKLDIKEILRVSLTLFAVIDVLGAIPIFLDLRSKTGNINSLRATLVSGGIMFAFLFLGASMLSFFGVDVPSFALAGSFILFLMALEMILGINLFRSKEASPRTVSVMPIAFPLIAGAGTLTTIITLKSQYDPYTIAIGILLNLIIVYIVLRFLPLIERLLGNSGIEVLRRIFGVILLAMAIKIFKTNLLWNGV